MRTWQKYVGLAALVLAVVSFFGAGSLVVRADLPRDCDTGSVVNSLINCGATTADELKQKYTDNKPGDLPAVYDAYGLNGAVVTSAATSAKMGEVRKDGTVVVDGQTVATEAKSLGRADIAGSAKKIIGGKTYYERAPSVSFKSNSIVAYVFFDADGQFRAAILTSCGNPVSAKPVPPKKPASTYVCNTLQAKLLADKKYSFATTATVTGDAAIAGYSYDFGDGKTLTSPDKTVEHTYVQPGTYLATVTVNVKVGNETKTVTGTGCQAQAKPTSPPEMCATNPKLPKDDAGCAPCDVPGKEQLSKNSPDCATPPAIPPTPPADLPHTGPTDVIGSVLGAGALFAAGYYWFVSRRDLVAAFLKR